MRAGKDEDEGEGEAASPPPATSKICKVLKKSDLLIFSVGCLPIVVAAFVDVVVVVVGVIFVDVVVVVVGVIVVGGW
eukprot:CAMPEP_0206476874 /NCGR_PEP_ID=MMETSP0324_2-20121206/35000_1 /ASSEMBLY_ACC=CAM_ASM_000836 /TAXON_ID=2866 /ORGANISM="Crypthecodinium cohnii, Strain Seligo" /LENGTH=76 /DNA_ID=CAMNT_0053952637 /DNA_START=51 /DNA_END=278 /DNA_ORIENTATION=+